SKARDGCCVVTSEPPSQCEVCHILPYSVGKSQARSTIDLWTVLEMFWGSVRTANVKELIFGLEYQDSTAKTLVNRLYNVLTLSRNAHGYWADGLFVLEPYPDDGAHDQHTQRAVFRWIYPNESSRIGPGSFTDIDIADATPALRTDLTGDGHRVVLFNLDTNQLVQDGDIVTFHTHDPITHPLPSRELLWLQCFLVRVLRMAGRAGWDMREMNYSDSDIDSVRTGDDLESKSLNTDPPFLGDESTPRGNRRATNANTDASIQTPKLPPKPGSRVRVKSHFFRGAVERVKDWIR
ncbi:hypothetical protein GP486_001999, partial [Trichoglossum hirsutum]